MARKGGELFDDWPERYDQWFETPIGALVKKYETDLLLNLLKPHKGEMILDAGCGTGIFTRDILISGADVTGMDISKPMLQMALKKSSGYMFKGVAGDMKALPFADNTFDKVVTVTALEFIADVESAITELFRVSKRGGVIVAATLNSLSPWAEKRKQAAQEGHSLFKEVIFRSPDDMRALAGGACEVETAIHFKKDDAPDTAVIIEKEGRESHLMTGAFVAAKWEKR